MKNAYQFHTLSEFHAFCQLPKPEHPLISVIDYSQVQYPVEDRELRWIQHFYAIGLKKNVQARFNYGQQPYDFDAGVLSFVSPLQFLKLEINPQALADPQGWLLLIHPDFLWNTALSTRIQAYDFFQYAVNEALFLSEKEEAVIADILRSIEKEYTARMDKFSQELIVKQLERLLIYSERFYERQFLTRKKPTQELVERFEKILAKHFVREHLEVHGIPTVSVLAEQLHISANYLGSLLRIYTQQNTQQHIQNNVISYAKMRLSSSTLSVSEIAYELGFDYPQSFSKLFKAKTNRTPQEFRAAFR